MSLHRLRSATDVVDPPRDGEFFFDETGEDVRREDAALAAGHFGALVGRHPILWVGAAMAMGVVTAVLLLQL
jgi:hypothetical protein